MQGAVPKCMQVSALLLWGIPQSIEKETKYMHRKKWSIRWDTMKILVFGFLGVIFLGGFLLWLPVCNRQPIAFMDALFTSVTAVCVTGLVTITPAVQFTLLGKVILLILIQVGGLGVIGCATAFFLILRKKITVKERVVLQETYNMDKLGGMVGMVKKVIIGTFVVEGAGALFYSFQFVPEYGVIRGIWYSVFHSISAFCNAGIDILGSGSFTKYAGNPLINITTMLLIILGGLGFTVWFDVIGNGKKIYKHEVPRKWWFTRLKLQSRLVLLATVSLIVLGAVLVFVLEYRNPDTLGGMSLGEKVMASFFQSVTNRTAGYATISQSGLHTETKLVNSILMFIGGSPGGTAGGVKTTTFVMLFLGCMTFVKGGNDIECLGRKISTENFRSGFAVTVLAVSAYLVGIFLILTFESDQIAAIDVIYEASSAIGTVGLTADLTPNLTRLSQAVLMILMYIGRIGPVTLMLVFAGKMNPQDKIRELPKERIMVG